MCGIAGWVDWERDMTQTGSVLQDMTNTMALRGPDDEGIWYSQRAALGHRRLAIIDIEGGRQPMIAECSNGRRVLTYSGEIYNFEDLRGDLEAKRHRFRTRSDTEVVLRSFLEWGPECVTRFNGMFAFAIWDESTEELVLARDRLGVKPLYYVEYEGGVLFGSEIKVLLANPLVPAEVGPEGLAELMCLNSTPGHAVFRGIKALRPGHIARFSRAGCRETTYWHLTGEAHADDAAATVCRVRELLEDIVERQLVSDVAIGSLLSGGLDSSTLSALASQQLAGKGLGPLSTYAVDFRGSERHFQPSDFRYDLDKPFARKMAEHIGAQHGELVLDGDTLLDARRETLLARDLPGWGDVNASLYLLFKNVRKDCKVVLSGEAADEVFGGYAWFHREDMLKAPRFPWAVSDELLSMLSPQFHAEVRPKEYMAERYAQAMAEVPTVDGEQTDEVRVREMFYLNLTRFVPVLLDNKDRLSMRAGLEVRVPFCDYRLVEYVWNVPWLIKCLGGRAKGLLREAAKDLLPAEVYSRRKTGFPVATDPMYELAIREQLADEVSSSTSPLGSLVAPERVHALLNTARSGPGLWRSVDVFSQLLQLADWLRTYRIRLL